MLPCWAPKAAQLFPRHTYAMFVCLYVLKWGGYSWIVLSFSGFDRKSQRRDLGFKNTPSIPLVCCWPCPSKTTLHPIQLSSEGCMWYFLFMSHKLQKSQRLSHMQCEVICQSLGMALVSNGQGCSYASSLEKRTSVKRSLRRAILCEMLLKYNQFGDLMKFLFAEFSFRLSNMYWAVHAVGFPM